MSKQIRGVTNPTPGLMVSGPFLTGSRESFRHGRPSSLGPSGLTVL